MGLTKNTTPEWGRVGRYPFETVSAGTVWWVKTLPQAESICSSFASWAKRRGVALRASRVYSPDITAITFIEKAGK